MKVLRAIGVEDSVRKVAGRSHCAVHAQLEDGAG